MTIEKFTDLVWNSSLCRSLRHNWQEQKIETALKAMRDIWNSSLCMSLRHNWQEQKTGAALKAMRDIWNTSLVQACRRPLSSYFPKTEETELGAPVLSAELLHVACRTINAAAVTFSIAFMVLIPFMLSRSDPDHLSHLNRLLQLSAIIAITGGVAGAGYGLGELSQRESKTT